MKLAQFSTEKRSVGIADSAQNGKNAQRISKALLVHTKFYIDMLFVVKLALSGVSHVT